MGEFNFLGIKPMKTKTLNIKSPKIPKIHITRIGDRTLTSAQRRKLKEAVGYRCEICRRNFSKLPKYLEIHHKKSISSFKNPLSPNIPVLSIGKKIKPVSDRKSNFQVICKDCHDKTKKKRKKQKPFYLRY